MYIEVESVGWWVAMKWRVTGKLWSEMALRLYCTQNVTNIDKPMAYIMNKLDADFPQDGHLYKPNRGIMETQVLMDIWQVSEKQTSQLLEVVLW